MPAVRWGRVARTQVIGWRTLLLLCPGSGHAQASATVPATSLFYERVEAVSAWFPAAGVFLGERPMSVRDARRVLLLLTTVVGRAPQSSRREWAAGELTVLSAELDAAPNRPMHASWRGQAGASNARGERLEPNGLGGRDSATGARIGIDALRHSFDAMRDGVPVDRRSIAFLPTLAVGTARVATVVEPLIAATGTAADSGRWAPALHRAYARGTLRNAAIRVGAEEMRWGQSPSGAMFISGNAAPLVALTVGTDTPVTLPWLFRVAGPFRVTAMLADLGAAQTPSHAKLAGWQASIAPSARFELGVAVVAQSGGTDAPPATLLERIVDLFPVIDALAPQHSDLQISNKLAGGSLRLRFPELSGLDFYYELQIDDFDGRRLRSSLVDDAGHLLGLRLPLLVGGQPLTWRAEWQRTSLRLYEHAQFESGYTYHSKIIGNPLGPNAIAAQLGLRWEASRSSRVEVAFSGERRNPSIYRVTVSGPRDRGFTFVPDTLIPDRRRDRVTASFERALGASVARATVGGAHTAQRGFPSRNEWFVEVALRRDMVRVF